MTTTNGTISGTTEEPKEKPEHSFEIRGCGCMIFGIIASMNLIFCTPIYLVVITWLAARAMGE